MQLPWIRNLVVFLLRFFLYDFIAKCWRVQFRQQCAYNLIFLIQRHKNIDILLCQTEPTVDNENTISNKMRGKAA